MALATDQEKEKANLSKSPVKRKSRESDKSEKIIKRSLIKGEKRQRKKCVITLWEKRILRKKTAEKAKHDKFDDNQIKKLKRHVKR